MDHIYVECILLSRIVALHGIVRARNEDSDERNL